jgi:V8-like Glu-specific endopeptidase
MFQRRIVVASLAAVLGGACSRQATVQTTTTSSPIIFGADDRLEYGAITDPTLKGWADATAAVFSSTTVTCDGTTCTLFERSFTSTLAGNLQTITFQTTPVCATDRLYGQTVGAFASAFLVGPDLLVTAAHVTNVIPCAQFRAVFGFAADAQGQNVPASVPTGNVYSCSAILAQKAADDSTGHIDWVLMKLDRPVTGNRTPLGLRQSGTPAAFTPTTLIGYPEGVALKAAPNGQIVGIAAGNAQFYTNNDDFAGNSGSPVINSTTGLVEGILTTGSSWDYIQTTDASGATCAVANQCTNPNNSCSFTWAGAQVILPVSAALHCGDGTTDGDETGADCGGPTCIPRCGLGAGCAADADCATGTLCAGGTCKLPCFDGLKDQAETDVDCGGGTCGLCALGKHCGANGDCVNNLCASGTCQALCANGVKDGDEIDVDCGGSCSQRCANGQRCAASSDCANQRCVNGTCYAPVTCFNSDQDYPESDIDCGGPQCAKCGLGAHCYSSADCASASCKLGRCMALCNDQVKNGAETDVDCGGGSCAACAVGAGCLANSDCSSALCIGGTCAPTTCANDDYDYPESDIDCGGPQCAKCGLNARCFSGADCASGSCQLGRCMILCNDHVKNGAETDVDCGGGACAACALGAGCNAGTDCSSGVCVGGKCAPSTCANNETDFPPESDTDCGGPQCAKCPVGGHCYSGADCASGSCQLGRCMILCNDHVKNGTETDVDCGGSCTTGCDLGLHCNVGTDCASGNCVGGVCKSPPP